MSSHIWRSLLIVGLVAGTLPMLAACDDGPAEEVGEAIDEGVESTGEAIENLGEKAQEATD